MTARVISNIFTIEHNRLAALEQEYELAKVQHREVLKHRNPLNKDHEKRFMDAQERVEVAREAYIREMDEYG